MRLVQKEDYHSFEAEGQKAWVLKYPKAVLSLTVLSALVACGMLYHILTVELLLYLLLPTFIAIIYPLTVQLPFKAFSSLRKLAGLKLLLISFCWSAICSFVPNIYFRGLRTEFLIEFVMLHFFVAGISIPFDIRDIEIDDPGLKTLPQFFGVSGALEISKFMILLYQFWIIARYLFFDLSLLGLLAWLTGLEIIYFMIIQSKKHRENWYFNFWLEASPIILLMCHLIAMLF